MPAASSDVHGFDAPWLRPEGRTLHSLSGQQAIDSPFGVQPGLTNLQHLASGVSLLSTSSTTRADEAAAMCRTPAVLQRPTANSGLPDWQPSIEGMQALPRTSERLRR